MFTGVRKITGNGMAAGCQLFYRKIYGFIVAVYCSSHPASSQAKGTWSTTFLLRT